MSFASAQRARAVCVVPNGYQIMWLRPFLSLSLSLEVQELRPVWTRTGWERNAQRKGEWERLRGAVVLPECTVHSGA